MKQVSGYRMQWASSALERRAQQLSKGVGSWASLAVRFQRIKKTVGGMDCALLKRKLGGSPKPPGAGFVNAMMAGVFGRRGAETRFVHKRKRWTLALASLVSFEVSHLSLPDVRTEHEIRQALLATV